MDHKPEAFMALDTSNYTTSLAVLDREENVILDDRRTLKVKQGERGLRQSHALFQHMENLPGMIEQAFKKCSNYEITGIGASSRPRPVENSYMPVFLAGVSFGKTIAASLSIPFIQYSHQEGHLAAASYNSIIDPGQPYLAFQLSGGTCELLCVENGSIQKIGGSLDLSYGQVIDRIGVAMGIGFPCGKELDELALDGMCKTRIFTPVPFKGLDINLSGLETQALRLLSMDELNRDQIVQCLFTVITESLVKWTEEAIKQTGCHQILYTGGVSASEFIRNGVRKHFNEKPVASYFGHASLSTDNAVGIALLGGKSLWV